MNEFFKLTIEEIKEEIKKLQNNKNRSNIENKELELLKKFEQKTFKITNRL